MDTLIPPAIAEKAAGIRLLVLDVDGVLTDGSLVYHADGSESKTFNVHDGLGIKTVLHSGIGVAVISGRGGGAVEHRLADLGIVHFRLCCGDKRAALDEIAAAFGVGLDAVACVGDDLPDIMMFEACALAVAVADATAEARRAADWTTMLPGGRGAVREVCDLLLRARGHGGN